MQKEGCCRCQRYKTVPSQCLHTKSIQTEVRYSRYIIRAEAVVSAVGTL